MIDRLPHQSRIYAATTTPLVRDSLAKYIHLIVAHTPASYTLPYFSKKHGLFIQPDVFDFRLFSSERKLNYKNTHTIFSVSTSLRADVIINRRYADGFNCRTLDRGQTQVYKTFKLTRYEKKSQVDTRTKRIYFNERCAVGGSYLIQSSFGSDRLLFIRHFEANNRHSPICAVCIG